MKKCKKCGAPLEGFLYKTIGKLMGIKPSEKDPEVCNKCTEEPAAPVSESQGKEPVAENTEVKTEVKIEETAEEKEEPKL